LLVQFTSTLVDAVGEALADEDRPRSLANLLSNDEKAACCRQKGSRLYRYYTSMDAIRNRAGENTETFVRLPAGMVETAVVQQIRTLLLTPEVTARAIEAAQRECPVIEQPDVVAALTGFDALWESLFPAEQARIARLLVERVTVGSDGMAVDLRTEGLGSVVRAMVTPRREMAA